MRIVSKLVGRLARVTMRRWLQVSAVFTIIGLAFMVWSLLQPTPMPVMLAMSVGQLFGTTAFVVYLVAIVIDLRRERRARRESQQMLQPPPEDARARRLSQQTLGDPR